MAAGASLDAATVAELRQLRADNRRQAQELTILKKAIAMSRYRFIDMERAQHPVRQLCHVLGVPASGYYAWRARKQPALWPATGPATPAWETVLVKVFGQHKRRYGTRRLQVALRHKGHQVGRQRLRTAMRRRGLHALQPKAYTPRTTDSTHGLRCALNRLLDQPKPTHANRVWVSDITYLPLATGHWAYLCAFQDMSSKQVVGWHVMATMPEELVTTALQRAFLSQPLTPQPLTPQPLTPQPLTPQPLVHSDRGGQYCANAYRALLAKHGALRSQSRRGECYDNAQAESLWSRLKTALLELREWPVFADLTDAQTSVADYFDYYNHERLHSSIDYQTPHHAHQQLLPTTTLNFGPPHVCLGFDGS
ncbi:Transposase InsO and inactivated derivatives [Hymenobacter psychrophilus]|uniref:Transposase InsO and inactivated derivatives n=2 Tax=Hymenobacter psychrophilus TaxID=651662 RepID=A0A1H3PC43_9BACT|nr:Transposase InsO and inactivated derivatives [Hymenobacter psychrophilus]